jgi:hypothetical protein
LLWVLWGTASPRSLRFFLRTLLVVRNALARPFVAASPFIEWRPREIAQAEAAPVPVHGEAHRS